MISSIHSAGLASAGMAGAPFLSKYWIRLDELRPKSKRECHRQPHAYTGSGEQSHTTKEDSFPARRNQEKTIKLVEQYSRRLMNST